MEGLIDSENYCWFRIVIKIVECKMMKGSNKFDQNNYNYTNSDAGDAGH